MANTLDRILGRGQKSQGGIDSSMQGAPAQMRVPATMAQPQPQPQPQQTTTAQPVAQPQAQPQPEAPKMGEEINREIKSRQPSTEQKLREIESAHPSPDMPVLDNAVVKAQAAQFQDKLMRLKNGEPLTTEEEAAQADMLRRQKVKNAIDEKIAASKAADENSLEAQAAREKEAHENALAEAKASEQGADGDGTQKPVEEMTMTELLQQLYADSKAEDEKARKKEKRDKIFAAIGDGIGALSNLYFTTQYAPNAFDPTNTMSDRTRERWERWMKDKKDNDNIYINARMRAYERDRAAAEADRQWRWQMEQAAKKAAADEAEREYQHGRDKVKDKQFEQSLGQKGDIEREKNETKRVIAKENNDTKKATAGARGKGGGGRGGKGSTWSAVDENGVVHNFPASGKDNAHSFAGGRGWQVIGPVKESTTTKGYGKSTTVTKTSTGKPKSGYEKTKGLGL